MKHSPIKIFLIALQLIGALIVPQAAMATTTIKLDGSTTLQPLAQSWASAYHKAHPTVNVIVAGGGSGVGFSHANSGLVDIGMSSREPNAGWESGLTKTRVAKDAVAVVVNPNNPVRKLTRDQIQKIYNGTYTNWKQVGGPSATIVLCGRTGASGTYAFFKEKFLLGTKQSSRTKQYASNGMVRSAVARTKYGIGYVSIAYINSSVRGITVGGVAPTKANAASGKYSYVRALYFLTKGTMSSGVKAFVAYCNSTAGQRIAMKEYLHR